MRGQYNDEKGILTGNYNLSKTGQSKLGFSWAGSVAVLDDGFYTGRPVNDSFAVVKIAGRKNVPVELYNSVSGYTDDEGELLIPELTSYFVNNINIQDNIVALNESIDTTEQRVRIKQRGGSKVPFNIRKFTAIEGNIILLTADNRRVTLASVPINIVANDKKYESFIGRDGYFYFENIPVGKHILTVLLYKGNCTTIINVPESDKIVQNLGDLTCRKTARQAEHGPAGNRLSANDRGPG